MKIMGLTKLWMPNEKHLSDKEAMQSLLEMINRKIVMYEQQVLEKKMKVQEQSEKI